MKNTFNGTQQQNKQKMYYDQHASDMKELKVNDNVMVLTKNNNWEPALVIKIDYTRPRSYVVKLINRGIVLIRNRKFLKKYKTNRFSNVKNSPVYDTILDEMITTFDTNTDLNEEVITETGGKLRDQNIVTRSGRIINKPHYLKDYI